MRRLFAPLALCVLLVSISLVGQTSVSPPIVTASQRALWDRLKADNHPYFQQTCREAQKDTTTGERYGSRGRWSALAYQMGCGEEFAQRAYEVTKRVSKTWTPGSLGTSNELREHAVEHALSLTWVAPGLTAAQIAEWKGWLISNADAALAAQLRLNDTDQTTGTLMFWLVMDRALGTSYGPNPKVIAAREAVRGFVAHGATGGYPVMGDYEYGDLYLLYSGAAYVGLEQFPEVVAHQAATAKLLMHWTTPDLKDTFELGDDQSPNSVTWHAREDLYALLGHTQPEVRSFELAVRAALNTPDGVPMYARYFMWANPYTEATDWKPFAGTFLPNLGLGRVYARTGQTADDCGLLAYLPPFSTNLGAFDHIYDWFGHVRIRCGSTWALDSPIGYTANVQLANQTVLAGLPASGEVGVLTAAERVGSIVYMSGTNAGLNVNSAYYNPPATYRHELSPSLFWIPSWQVLVKVERIHLDDPKLQTVTPTSTTLSLTRFSAANQTAIKAAPLIRSFWHSQTVPLTVTEGVLQGDSRIRPLYPATIAIVDMATNGVNYGTLSTSERKWFATVDPVDQTPGFRVLTTIIGDATGTVEQLDGVQRVRVSKTGQKDIVIYSSTTPGPKLVTTRSGSSSIYDRTKADGILLARSIQVGDWKDSTADVYVEHADRLEQLDPPPPPPAPSSPGQEFIQQLRDLIEKYGPLVK